MIDLHPEFLTKNGKKEFVVFTYEEFIKIKELLEDAEDLMELRKIKLEEKESPLISFSDVKKQFS